MVINIVKLKDPIYDRAITVYKEKMKAYVRERDKCTCQHCLRTEKEVGHVFHVHHLKDPKFFEDEHDAWHPDNIVLLCPLCHKFVNSSDNIENLFIDPETTKKRYKTSNLFKRLGIDFLKYLDNNY